MGWCVGAHHDGSFEGETDLRVVCVLFASVCVGGQTLMLTRCVAYRSECVTGLLRTKGRETLLGSASSSPHCVALATGERAMHCLYSCSCLQLIPCIVQEG
jgi:hypothetical protein